MTNENPPLSRRVGDFFSYSVSARTFMCAFFHRAFWRHFCRHYFPLRHPVIPSFRHVVSLRVGLGHMAV